MIHSTNTQNAFVLIGRALIALLFIPAGIGKIMGFAATTGYIASKGVPVPAVAAAIAIVVEVGLGTLLLVGWQARWAALGIAGFTAVITFIFHPYWALPAEVVTVQKLFFFKNLAIVGGLLAIASCGAGAWSLDAKQGQK